MGQINSGIVLGKYPCKVINTKCLGKMGQISSGIVLGKYPCKVVNTKCLPLYFNSASPQREND
jgi:hypothetical protein